MERALQIRAAAHHEAGHVVMAWRLYNPIREGGVRIDEGGGGGGGGGGCYTRKRMFFAYYKYLWQRPVWPSVVKHVGYDVMEYLSGWAAEHIYHNLGNRRSVHLEYEVVNLSYYGSLFSILRDEDAELDDTSHALGLLAEVRLAETGNTDFGELNEADWHRVTRRFGALESRVYRLLKHPRTWRAVSNLADVLVERRHVGPEEAESIIDSARPPRPSPGRIFR